MSWNVTVPAHDPNDPRGAVERLTKELAVQMVPPGAIDRLVAWAQAAQGAAPAGCEIGFNAIGHLNADGTGNYGLIVNVALAPDAGVVETVAGPALPAVEPGPVAPASDNAVGEGSAVAIEDVQRSEG